MREQMPLQIAWTRRANRLPPEVRERLAAMLERLHPYFPEMNTSMKIGITRFFDGLVHQSDKGRVKLMVDVHRTRKHGWKYPTYWTLAHEMMHLAQFNTPQIPSGERACDVYALSRLPPELIDDSPSYLVVPDEFRARWDTKSAALAHRLALEAISQRKRGVKRYAVWWEDEFEKATDGSK